MKTLILALTLVLSLSLLGSAFGQTLEVALNCVAAKNKLEVLAKDSKTDVTDISSIAKAVGTAVLTSCRVPSGKTVCYQCIGKDKKLRSIEVLHNFKSKSLVIKGYGCPCNERK